MPRVFETFVRNFLRRHLPHAHISARQFPWDATADTKEARALLPIMKTDVSIDLGDGRCIVLDCKFYANCFAQSFDQDRLNSDNLYQIAAYLSHHPSRSSGAKMYGVLLYPTVDADFLHQYDFVGDRLTVASVNLNQGWQSIHERLLQIVNEAARNKVSTDTVRISRLDLEIASLERHLAQARAEKQLILAEPGLLIPDLASSS
jgi:5-methylcytosine-specific restriction enzyme subunit McrC